MERRAVRGAAADQRAEVLLDRRLQHLQGLRRLLRHMRL
jgi:hypothetical protein